MSSVYSIGVDIVDVDRIGELIEARGNRFLNRVFTPEEIRYCTRKVSSELSFAARFAAKEAVFKAVGTGLNLGMSWRDVEVRNDGQGRPALHVSGKTSDLLEGRELHLSLSHTAKMAIAMVVVSGK